jgi:hypothetical protein
MAAFAGDQQAFSDAVFGEPSKPNPAPQAIGNLDRVAADSISRTGTAPTFVTIEHFGRADAAITTFHEPKKGDIEPVTLLYHGATGTFDRVKPSIGTRPSAGGTLAAIMGPLHFGNFAGVLSKAIWFGLGFAMCYVTLTGIRLWLARRRERQRSLDWLERAVTVIGFGLPLALLVAAAGYLVAMPLGSAVFWTPAAFLAACAVAIVAGATVPKHAILSRALQISIGVLLVALPLIRLASGGPGWPASIETGQLSIMAVDLAMLLGGAWTLWNSLPRRYRSDSGTDVILQPAE